MNKNYITICAICPKELPEINVSFFLDKNNVLTSACDKHATYNHKCERIK